VKSWRRFACPNKQTKFAGQAKCGVAKSRRGQSPNGVLRNPKMPNRHFCANRVLYEVAPYNIYKLFFS